MFRALQDRFVRFEQRVRRSFGTDISTPSARRWSRFHYNWLDHAILRTFWTNFAEIAPGVYRSNQPTHKRLEQMVELGIRDILNLRGEDKYAHYLFEKESCEQLGIRMHNVKLYARSATSRERYMQVFEAFRTLPRPFLLHCKSGADRAGMVSVLYLMSQEGVSLDEARKQLGLKHLHLKWSKTGILDHILDVYEERQAKGAIGIEEWFATEYDPAEITASYNARKGRAG